MDPVTVKVTALAGLVALALTGSIQGASDIVVEIGPELSRFLGTSLDIVTLILITVFGNRVVQVKRKIDQAGDTVTNNGTDGN